MVNKITHDAEGLGTYEVVSGPQTHTRIRGRVWAIGLPGSVHVRRNAGIPNYYEN